MKYILIILVFVFSLALAQNFSGTFQNDQNTGQIILQQAPDGSLQGSFMGANGKMQFQGYVSPQGAYGNLVGQDAQLLFQAQLSPDGNTLQLMIAPYGQNGQPDVNAGQQFIYRRVGVVQQNEPVPTPTQPANTDPFVGSFSDGSMTLQLQGSSGQYQGVFLVGGQQIPVSARGDASGLTGTITEQDVEYVFTLTPTSNGIVFAINGEQYPLQRQGVEANVPLTVNPTPTPTPQLTPVTPTPSPMPNPQPEPTMPTGSNGVPPGGFLETFDSPTSEFASYLLVGQEDPWTGELKDSSYQLSNSVDEGSVQYMYATTLTSVATPLSSQTVSVDVAGNFLSPDYSQAGVLFHFNPATGFYYAFVVKDNTVALVLRDADGFQELAATTTDALQVGQVNRLSVVPNETILRLLVNGAEVMSIDSPSLEPGGVGILAAGTGTFQFDNFSVEPATP